MSIENATRELEAFLKEPGASAVALTGRWGVGKTHAWRKVVAAHQKSPSGKAQPYSYVSLFGVGSIDDVKAALFTQMRTVDSGQDVLGQKTNWLVNRLRVLPKHRDSLPTVLHDWVPDLKPIMFMAVKDWLICFDDLERRGIDLDLQDLLGLISFLREERNCKILVIANDEAFQDANAVFRRNFEKVFDRQVAYEPTPIEAGWIGARSTSRAAGYVREAVELLGITNIRVIQKLAKVAEQVGVALASSQDTTVQKIVRSIVLIGWSVLEPELAPSIAYIKGDWMLANLLDREPSVEERGWAELMRRVEFEGFGETEDLILTAFAKGYLDDKALAEFCVSIDEGARRSIAREPFLEILAELENEWGGSADDLVNRLSDAMTAAGTSLYITTDVNRACSVFEALQRPDLSEKHALSYVDALAPDDKVLDPHYNDAIPSYVAALRTAIEARGMPACDQRSVMEFLEGMLEGVSSTDDMERLQGLTADDFYAAFRTYKGRRMRHHIAALRHHYPQSVRLNVETALRRLGDESPLNAYRLAKLKL